MTNVYQVRRVFSRNGAASEGWRIAGVVLALCITGLGEVGAQPGHRRPRPIIVSSSAELEAALTPANAGRRFHVLPGEYVVNVPLLVPDGATLEAEGVMLFDDDGLPSGFEPGTESRIKAAPGVTGDLLTLGDGATVRNLVVEGRAAFAGGNVIVVASRGPGNSVSASIRDCEIIAHTVSGTGPNGPTGRSLAVFTQNMALGSSPPPDEDAVVRVDMKHSIVRAPNGGSAVFADNFAARGQVTVSLTGNRLGGSLDASGGTSRPDLVDGAVTSIESRRNLYARPGDPGRGWAISGGSTTPFALPAPGASLNVARVDSVDDRIEGFRTGVFSSGAQRTTTSAGLVSDNLVELRLRGTRIRTEAVAGLPARDLVLQGARSSITGVSAGNGNTLRLLIRGAIGSGPSASQYASTSGPLLPEDFGVGNRLEIIGSPRAFERTNDGFDPAPSDEFFIGPW